MPSLSAIFGMGQTKNKTPLFQCISPTNYSQTEIINKSLGNLLRCLTNEHGVSQDFILPHVKFAYNNYINRSSTPFKFVYGLQPRTLIDVIPLPLPQKLSKSRVDFAAFMTSLHDNVRSKMTKQTTKYVAHTNLHKRDMQFKKRDLVLIRINSVTSKKVSPWHL